MPLPSMAMCCRHLWDAWSLGPSTQAPEADAKAEFIASLVQRRQCALNGQLGGMDDEADASDADSSTSEAEAAAAVCCFHVLYYAQQSPSSKPTAVQMQSPMAACCLALSRQRRPFVVAKLHESASILSWPQTRPKMPAICAGQSASACRQQAHAAAAAVLCRVRSWPGLGRQARTAASRAGQGAAH